LNRNICIVFKQQFVPLSSLKRWGDKSDQQLQPTDYSLLEGPRHRISPFPYIEQINNRFIIW